MYSLFEYTQRKQVITFTLTVRFIKTHRLKVKVRLSPLTIVKHLLKLLINDNIKVT